MTGWALLTTRGADLSRLMAIANRPVTSVVYDPGQGLTLAVSGMVAGLLVVSYESLAPIVELLVPPAYGHGHEGGRRPEIRTSRVRPEWTR